MPKLIHIQNRFVHLLAVDFFHVEAEGETTILYVHIRGRERALAFRYDTYAEAEQDLHRLVEALT